LIHKEKYALGTDSGGPRSRSANQDTPKELTLHPTRRDSQDNRLSPRSSPAPRRFSAGSALTDRSSAGAEASIAAERRRETSGRRILRRRSEESCAARRVARASRVLPLPQHLDEQPRPLAHIRL